MPQKSGARTPARRRVSRAHPKTRAKSKHASRPHFARSTFEVRCVLASLSSRERTSFIRSSSFAIRHHPQPSPFPFPLRNRRGDPMRVFRVKTQIRSCSVRCPEADFLVADCSALRTAHATAVRRDARVPQHRIRIAFYFRKRFMPSRSMMA